MKIVLLLVVVCLSGCVVPHWPKDAYVEHAESDITTVWGTSKQKAKVMATGTAANNTSKLNTK